MIPRTHRAMHRVAPALLTLLFVLLQLGSCGGGGDQVGNADSAQAYMDALASEGKFTGAVLVAKGDTVLLSKGYGWADAELRVANTPQTKFRIGSNSKQFTAMAILLLEQQGRLHVSDLLCSFIEACPTDWEAITLKHLLTHTSGVPDYTNFEDFPQLIGTAVSVTDLIARFKQLPLDIAPGSRWLYSNSGYVLLGAVIEKASGQSYAEYLKTQIFTPLQMTHTGYDDSAITAADHARGNLTPTRTPVFIDMSEFFAAGALYSTVEDLLLWDRALMNNRLVPAAVLAPMITAQVPCPAGGCAMASDTGYGYGWFIAEVQQRRDIYHWGRIDGFTSSNSIFPDQQVSVIVLSNLETSSVFQSGVDLGLITTRSEMP